MGLKKVGVFAVNSSTKLMNYVHDIQSHNRLSYVVPLLNDAPSRTYLEILQ